MENTKSRKCKRTRNISFTVRMTQNERDNVVERLKLVNPHGTQLDNLKEVINFYIKEKKL